MSRELKKYNIRATKKPAANKLLASTVVVRNEAGEVGYCYINFDLPFVEKVGKVLPRGLMETDPAYISVRYYPRKTVWLIIAAYITGEHETLLWKTTTKPTWLNFYRTKNHASDSQKAGSSGAEGSGRQRATRA